MPLVQMGLTTRRVSGRSAAARSALAVALITGITGTSVAQAADDLAFRGSAIAAEKCGRCHAVGIADASPHKITPPLRELAAEFPIPMLEKTLKTGIVGGHDEMPQFDLGLDGARALVAYIDSLNPKGPHYLGKAP